jgi:hypothetical protein
LTVLLYRLRNAWLPARWEMTGLRQAWLAHRLLFAIVALYALAALAISVLVGSPKHYAIGKHVAIWVPALVAVPLVLGALAVLRGRAEGSRRSWRGSWRLLGDPSPGDLVIGFALALAVGLFYASFVVLKNTLPLLVPFYADPTLAAFDAALHGGVDPWRLIEPLFRLKPLPALTEFAYGFVWATLLVYGPVLVALHPAFKPWRVRFFLTFFASWIGLGNLGALAFMSGGPVYFGHLTGDHERFGELLRFTAENGLFTGWVQDYLWENYSSGSVELATGISAFPSLHVAMATLYFLLARHFGRIAAAAAGAFLGLILAGSVILGWHYAVDGYASILFVALAWFWTGRGDARRAVSAAR